MKWDKEAQRLFDEGLDFACVSGVSVVSIVCQNKLAEIEEKENVMSNGQDIGKECNEVHLHMRPSVKPNGTDQRIDK